MSETRDTPGMIGKEELRDKFYLGDGVYVGHDGFHVVLWLEQPGGFGPNAIALEPEALRALHRYVERVNTTQGER